MDRFVRRSKQSAACQMFTNPTYPFGGSTHVKSSEHTDAVLYKYFLLAIRRGDTFRCRQGKILSSSAESPGQKTGQKARSVFTNDPILGPE